MKRMAVDEIDEFLPERATASSGQTPAKSKQVTTQNTSTLLTDQACDPSRLHVESCVAGNLDLNGLRIEFDDHFVAWIDGEFSVPGGERGRLGGNFLESYLRNGNGTLELELDPLSDSRRAAGSTGAVSLSRYASSPISERPCGSLSRYQRARDNSTVYRR